MKNVTETTTGSGTFSADLVISFDQAFLLSSRKPITIPMGFTVNTSDPGAPAAAPLVTCSSVSSNTLDFPALCKQLNGFYNTANSPPTCDPTYQ